MQQALRIGLVNHAGTLHGDLLAVIYSLVSSGKVGGDLQPGRVLQTSVDYLIRPKVLSGPLAMPWSLELATETLA
jgi:hypothetical protein